jgi:hypothetical protein
MPLGRWVGLIGIVTGLGMLQVAQRNAVVLRGYAVGSRVAEVHQQETELSWLGAQVMELSSPGRLAQVAKDRQLKLVARSTLAPARPLGAMASPMPPLAHVASLPELPPRPSPSGDETQD